ncbi:MAG: acetyltransferase [Roseomonas sp.]|nr:acetyltransferase [Roseomonas sp.]MCA3381610.1 acetyltransferase [Roseomonas sp.]
MTRKRILLLGAGGQGKAIADLLLSAGGFELVGFLDASPKASQVLGLPVLGDESLLAALAQQGITLAHPSLGDNAQRLAAAGRLKEAGFALPNLTHPSALIGHGARLGDGAAVLARAVIGPEAEIGPLALINTGAIVEHDCVVGEAAHIGPGVVLAGGVRIGTGALIGAGAVVRPGLVIGEGAVIGAGAAVVENIAPDARVGGVPARPM